MMKVRANTRRQELHNYNHYCEMITVPQVWQLPHPTCSPFSQWPSKSWIQSDTVLKTKPGPSQSWNKSLSCFPLWWRKPLPLPPHHFSEPWSSPKTRVKSLLWSWCSLENNTMGPGAFVVLSGQGDIHELPWAFLSQLSEVDHYWRWIWHSSLETYYY